jgi:hypothetical protein
VYNQRHDSGILPKWPSTNNNMVTSYQVSSYSVKSANTFQQISSNPRTSNSQPSNIPSTLHEANTTTFKTTLRKCSVFQNYQRNCRFSSAVPSSILALSNQRSLTNGFWGWYDEIHQPEMQDALDLALTSRVFLEAYRKAFIPRIRFDYHWRHLSELFWLQKVG